MKDVKSNSSSAKKPKPQGNYIDSFVKRMFGRVLLFTDFLVNYADPKFVAEIDVKKIQPAPTHYIGQKGDERIVDLVFQCPLKSGNGNLMAGIIFEHQSSNLKAIPRKLLKYVSAIWEAEAKEGKPLSAPYFIVLRTGKKPYRGKYSTMLDALPKGKDGKPIGNAVEVEYDVVDLPAAWDFNKLIGGAELRLALGMLYTMTGDALDEYPKALLPLAEITDEKQRIELTKELLDFVAKAFAAHNQRVDEVALSKALHPVLRGKERTMIKTIFEEREDIAEARGAVRGKAEMVLTALRTKYRKVPKDVEQAVFAMTDPIALESLLAQAIQSDTLDEFTEALQ
jgi:hypothetical protein